MHGEKNDLGADAILLQKPHSVQTIQERHRNVRDYNGRTQPLCGFNKRTPIRDPPNKLKCSFKKTLQPFGDDRVIVSQQNARSAHAWSPFNGTVARTAVPSPGRDCNSNTPCTKPTRSAMPISPNPPFRRSLSISNPQPSSLIERLIQSW